MYLYAFEYDSSSPEDFTSHTRRWMELGGCYNCGPVLTARKNKLLAKIFPRLYLVYTQILQGSMQKVSTTPSLAHFFWHFDILRSN